MAGRSDRDLGTLPFVLGGMSFIPLVGVLFGLIAITWGLITRRSGGRKLALILIFDSARNQVIDRARGIALRRGRGTTLLFLSVG